MSKTPNMNWRKHLRLVLLVILIVMLCYQSHTAFKLIMNPPMIVTTSEDDIVNVPAPLLYICPNKQYDYPKLKAIGYLSEFHLIKANETGVWGTSINETWEQLIRNVSIKSPEEQKSTIKILPEYVLLEERLYPKFGYCFDVKNYSMTGTLVFMLSNITGVTFLLSDPNTKSYIQFDPNSHQGEVLQIDKSAAYSYYINLEVHHLSETSNCNPQPEYSYANCVDDYVSKDFMPSLGCIPPLLSDHDHCEEKKSNVTNYISNYAQKYMSNVATKAETECKKPCRQLKMKVTLKGKISTPTAYGVFNFNPKVKVLTELPNYNWFNFIIDIGSSFGTWADLSAISLVDFALYPVISFKSFIKGN